MPSQKKKTPTEYLKLNVKSAQYIKLIKIQIHTESKVIYLGFT